jgi:hypothetical protein
MAFPTTSIISTFTGADENPLSEGGAWSGSVEGGGEVDCQRLSNQCTRGSASSSGAYRASASFTEAEVYMTLTGVLDVDAHYALVAARLIDPDTANRDYYAAYYWTSDNTIRVQRVINGAGTDLATSAALGALAVGNKIGLSVSGTGATVTVKGFFDDGGGWDEVVTFDDTNAARIVSAGTLGLRLSNTGLWTVDDFGGGEIVSATSAADDPPIGFLGRGAGW